MEQKKIIRVVVFPLFISLFLLGFTTIPPSVKASKKVRLISPTPYLFPELSISGHLFNFLPSFTTREELSSSKLKRRENTRISTTLNETPTASNQKSDLLSPVSEHQNPKLMKSNGESTLLRKDIKQPTGEKLNPTKPFLSNLMTYSTVADIAKESNTKEKTKKHDRHFIGHRIGGVGGVFPPVLKSSHKEYFDKQVSKIDPKDENIFENSKHVKSKHKNSTCVYDNKIYHAGQTIKLNQQSNPCDKCRCEQQEEGGKGVISCFWEQCEGLPAYDCVPLFIPGACCPIYTCDTDNDVNLEI